MKAILKIRAVIALTFIACSALAYAFPLNVHGLDTLNTAILIRDLRFGHDIVSANIDRSLIPASVMKSVTVASMLNLADPQERFATPVVATGTIRNGVLDGNLVVKVCGDPTIESQFLPETQGFADSIAAAVRRMGIIKIRGNVLIDESDFPDATTPPGWMDEDIPWYYGARLQGANFRDNRFRLRYPSKKTEPFVPDLKFSVIKGKGSKIDRKDGSETFLVRGTRAINDIFSMPYPRKAMSYEIVSTLKRAGVEVAGQSVKPSDEETEIYVHHSSPFGEIMQSLMFRSDNLMAEGMLRALTPGGTRADAIMEEQAVWSMAGISNHGINIVDGSGLSRDNRLTARFLGDVYTYMATDSFSNDYLTLFPKAGFDGTMKNFLVSTPLSGRVAMKTGSMKGVQSYGGYLFDENGYPTHVIVFMVNNFRCSRAALKKDIERLLLEKFNVSLQIENPIDADDQENNDEQRLDRAT